MLESLHIENIAVIERADISFREGLNVLTGETGAGKSIVIDSIGAILGDRVSREIVRTGAPYGLVTAVFRGSIADSWLEANDIPSDEELIISRKISPDSKSSCRVWESSRSFFSFPSPMVLPIKIAAAEAVPEPHAAATQTARTEAIAEAVGKTVEIVNQVVEAVVAEIAVTSALAQGDGEVRITLQPTVLDGSEIRLTAKSGELMVSIAPATVAKNAKDFAEKLAKMKELDPEPIVQEKIEGDGRGVSLLLGRDGELLSAICHRRLREFPASGGPSTLCVTEYDEFAIKKAHKLLKSFGFIGMAMVEFKGDAILEVNPRVWGSFPLTVFAGSSFTEKYAKAASGEKVGYTPRDYELGKKMRFAINDLAASADLIRHGRIGKGVAGLVDFFRVPEALKDADDPAPYKKYLRSYYKR